MEQITHSTLSLDGDDSDVPDTPSSPPPPAGDISSQVLVASAATPRAGGRYNLRSRVQGGAAAATMTQTPSSEALTKPLLAETGAGEAGESVGHAHHTHMHAHNGHHHHHHAHGGGSVHGGHGAHVPHHHHPVVTGDLKQGVVLLVAMSVHTFLECMALGLMVSGETGLGVVGSLNTLC